MWINNFINQKAHDKPRTFRDYKRMAGWIKVNSEYLKENELEIAVKLAKQAGKTNIKLNYKLICSRMRKEIYEYLPF